MAVGSKGLIKDIDNLYTECGGEVTFATVLSQVGLNLSDDDLAEVVEADGRKRIKLGLNVNLEMYLEVIGDTTIYPVTLDAAIDVTLRSFSGSSMIDESSVNQLVKQYPELEIPIREAAVINDAIGSTTGIREMVSSNRNIRKLPCEYGPTIPDGRRRYELKKLCGIGAAGQVYLANDKQLADEEHEAQVAVKIIKAIGAASQIVRFRLSDEATKARRVDHPNVVRVLDRGFTGDDEAYIVYEFVAGGDMREWLKTNKPPIAPKTAASLIAKIARGVQAAHSAGLVHCDLKPGNVMLTEEGEPKVSDFGVALRLSDGGDAIGNRGSGSPIGNLAFISPEQFRMEAGAFTPPSDIYALGGMLYQLITGKLPNGTKPVEIRSNHDPVNGRTCPPEIDLKLKGVDKDLVAICHKTLAMIPADRYDAAGSLADDLEAWLHKEPISWNRPTVAHSMQLWVSRNPSTAVIATILLISLIYSGAVVQYFASQAKFEKQFTENIKTFASDFGRKLTATTQTRPATSRFMEQAWSLKLMTDDKLLQQISTDKEHWLANFNTIENFIKQADEEGRGSHLHTLIIKTTYAFWLVGVNDLDKADAILDYLQAHLESVAVPEDTWLALINSIKACSKIRRLYLAGKSSEVSESELQSLADSEDIILKHVDFLLTHDKGSPLHYLLIETLELLYRPELLNKEEKLIATHKQLEALDDEMFVLTQEEFEEYKKNK